MLGRISNEINEGACDTTAESPQLSLWEIMDSSSVPPSTRTNGNAEDNRSEFEVADPQSYAPLDSQPRGFSTNSRLASTSRFASNSKDLHPSEILPMTNRLDVCETIEINQTVPKCSQRPSSAQSSLSSLYSQTAGAPQTSSSSDRLSSTVLAPADSPLSKCNSVEYPAVPRISLLTCTNCPRVFASRSLLQRHMKAHISFACTKGCGKSFTLKKDRKRHENTVHENQSLQCKYCGRTGRKDNIKRHMKTHGKLFAPH